MTRAGRRGRGDEGVTIVEVMVTTVILGVVTVALGGVLVSMARIDARSRARYDAGSELSLALDRMANEVRSGSPAPHAPPGGPSRGVTLIVRRGDGADTVRWAFEEGALVRTELDAEGRPTARAEVVDDVVAGESAVRHLDELGSPISGDWDAVASCAESVEMAVVVAVGGSDVRSDRVMTYRLRGQTTC